MCLITSPTKKQRSHVKLQLVKHIPRTRCLHRDESCISRTIVLLTTYTYNQLYAHEQNARNHVAWVQSIGVANKSAVLCRSWTLPNDSKHTESSFFFTIPTDLLCLRVAHLPRSRDLAILMLTTDNDKQNPLAQIIVRLPLLLKHWVVGDACAVDPWARHGYCHRKY